MSQTSRQDRRLLAKAALRMFDEWRLSDADRLMLLGFGSHDTDVLASMREKSELADSGELADRVRALLRIYRYLAMLYPEHPHLREKWMMSGHPRLGGEAPLERMKSGGAAGIRFVTTLLEEQLF